MGILNFLIKIRFFLKIKPFEECKNVLPLITWNFSKNLLRLLIFTILVYAAILDYFQKQTLSCFVCIQKTKEKAEEIFEKCQFLKNLESKLVFTDYSNISAILDFFSKNFNGFELRAQKSIKIDIQMFQKQHRTTKRLFPTLDLLLKSGFTKIEK